MSNLTVRIISAAVMAILIYAALVVGMYSRWAIMALILAVSGWEYARMISTKFGGPKVAWLAGILILIFTIPYFPGIMDDTVHLAATPDLWLWGTSITCVLVFTVIGFRLIDITNLAPWLFLNLFGCAFFGIYAAGIFGLLTEQEGWRGIFPLLMVQAAIATADSGAYFTGRKFGKRKLAPQISAKKTLEGALGGAALTVLIVTLLGPKLLHTGFLVNLGLGIILSGTAVLGDLFISVLKRYTDTKDSSNLIPGHGGVLDRFDALLFSAPVAVFYLHVV